MSLKERLQSARKKLIAVEAATRAARKAAREADQAVAAFHEAVRDLVEEHGADVGLTNDEVTALSGNEGKDP